MKKFILASALCAMAFTACQEEDFGVTSKDLYKSQYNQKFENQFGKVDPNQDWDFTRATVPYQTVASSDGWYYVENSTLTWFKNNMKEGVTNTSKVKAFTLTTSQATTFEIVPLYQGGAKYTWSVDMVVDGTVYSGWTWNKSDASLEGKKNNGSNWQKMEVYDSWAWTDYSSSANYAALRSKPTKIELGAGSHTIYFRIHSNANKGTDRNPNYVGTHTSIESKTWIGSLDVPTPTNVTSVNPTYTSKIITCEGYSIDSDDPDFNEAAFLLVGYVPEVIYNNETVTTTDTKRYMMEDFGAIDWDFNDVVVDVTTATTAKYTINTETGEKTPVDEPVITVTAKIAHLGGTYPVKVIVGETELPLISNPTNHEQTEAELAGTSATHEVATGGTNPGWEPANEPVAVRGYVASENNVKLIVYKNFDLTAPVDNENVYESTFPSQGSVPYIVATNAHAEWTAEGVSVTSTSWWNK